MAEENKQQRERKPFRKPREQKEFDDVVVSINRVSKTVKGGRRMRFAALVVVGDHKGRIGFGMGKAAEVPDAIKKANEAATKNVFRVQLVENNRTVPSDAIGKKGSTSVVLKPAAPGTGVIAGGAVRAVMEAVGITNIRTKCLRSNNPQNVVKAAMQGLMSLRSPEQVAAVRGKTAEEIVG